MGARELRLAAPRDYDIDALCVIAVYICPMHSVLETSIFTRRPDALLTREERVELITSLASDPQAGDLVPGLGGIRKMRFAAGGQGKRGGFRVIWFVSGSDLPVLALLLYGKNEQANPTPEQRRAMLAVVERMKAGQRRETA